MKTALPSVVLAFAALSQFTYATPIAEPRAVEPQLELLASLGITKVSDVVPDIPEAENGTSSLVLYDRQSGCTFRAFTGNLCDSGPGSAASVSYSAKCIATAGRHSFSVSGCNAYVSADPNSNCPTTNGYIGGVASPGCYNVNTGYDWRSSYVYAV